MKKSSQRAKLHG